MGHAGKACTIGIFNPMFILHVPLLLGPKNVHHIIYLGIGMPAMLTCKCLSITVKDLCLLGIFMACEENILFINVVSCPEGLQALAKKAEKFL